jgi:RNA polymerase sigma-70 factor (ECF subfamily)
LRCLIKWRLVKRNPDTSTDEELLMAARSGDQGAFAQLVKRHADSVATTAKGMLGDTPEAEDVGQETFVRLFHSLKTFRGESKLGTYLTRIAINLSINELRRRKRHDILYAPTGGRPYDARHVVPDPVSEFEYDAMESRDAVRTAIASLKPRLRAVIVLRLIDGYSTKETAAMLKIPMGTVLSRLSRAQLKLKEILAPHIGGGDDER